MNVQNYDRLSILPQIEDPIRIGDTVTIRWSGGDPAWTVYLRVNDIARHKCLFGIDQVPNEFQEYSWTIPAKGPKNGCPIRCGFLHQIYIENIQRTSWAHGPNFSIYERSSNLSLEDRSMRLDNEIDGPVSPAAISDDF